MVSEALLLVLEKIRFGNDRFQFFQALAAFFNERCVTMAFACKKF